MGRTSIFYVERDVQGSLRLQNSQFWDGAEARSTGGHAMVVGNFEGKSIPMIVGCMLGFGSCMVFSGGSAVGGGSR